MTDELPTGMRAKLSLMWRRVTDDMESIAQETIAAALAPFTKGGKIVPTGIQPSGTLDDVLVTVADPITGLNVAAWTTDPGGSGGGGSDLPSVVGVMPTDVVMTTPGTYYPGPSVDLAIGTWHVTGAITILGGTSDSTVTIKLWNGVNVARIHSERVLTGVLMTIPISALITTKVPTTYTLAASAT